MQRRSKSKPQSKKKTMKGPADDATPSAADKTHATRLLIVSVKNEAPFLLEWVAYHRALGFNRLVVFSSESDDGSTDLLDALAANDIIEHVEHAPAPGVERLADAARLANESAILNGADWAMWLDVDEFLVISKGNGTLDALIDALADRDGMLVPRRMMGDGGNDRFPGHLVSEDFTDAAAADDGSNLEAKTLFRCSDKIEGFFLHGTHRPKIRAGMDASDLSFVMASGNALDLRHRAHRRWISGEDFSRTRQVQPDEHGYALAQINCYAVRTPEHFVLKHNLAHGTEAGQTAQSLDQNASGLYRAQNYAATQDRRILRLADATRDQLTYLRSLPGVTEAEAEARTRLDTRLAGIPAHVLDACRATRPARVEPRHFPLTLPDEEAALLRAEYAKADTILEYGSGGSSFVALEGDAKTLFTVESDRAWALAIYDSLQAAHPHADFTVQYVDIGRTKAWGKPAGCEGYAQYARYPASVWDLIQFKQPDIVLVDGRFRVACFLTTLFRTRKPVTLLFDDYTGRPYYHWIEKYARPSQIAGRMARFDLEPMAIPPQDLTQILSAYADPQ